MTLNAGLNGSWYNAQQNGQGFLVEVLPEIGQVFVAWFSFDTMSSNGNTATIGDSNQRWFSAQGLYNGTEANLIVKSTSGGAFNQGDDTETVDVGTLNINFDGCRHAIADFSLLEGSISGSIDLTRISGSAVPFCESLK